MYVCMYVLLLLLLLLTRTASQEYEASVKITGPLVRQIVKQAHEPPNETEIKTLQVSARREKDELLKMQCEQVRESLPSKIERGRASCRERSLELVDGDPDKADEF